MPSPGEASCWCGCWAAANFPDVLMCRGLYQERPELPFTPGVELCGEVVAVGDAVRGSPWATGSSARRLPFGGFAEQALMDEATTFAAPDVLDDAQAASLYIGYQTGWFGLHRRAQLQAGETLLVHAAAGGVGSAAVQLGKAAGAQGDRCRRGCGQGRVRARAGRRPRHRPAPRGLRRGRQSSTGGHGADVIYDPVGGDTYQRSTKCVAFEGRILVVGFAGGDIQSAALNHALVKNYSIVGLHWGLYNRFDPAAVRACHDELTRMAHEGLISPVVSERLSFAGTRDGLQRLADGVTVGRVVSIPGA